MQKFSGLAVLAILVVIGSRAYSSQINRSGYIYNPVFPSSYPTYGYGVRGVHYSPYLPVRYGRTTPAEEVPQQNQFLPAYFAYPDHGVIGGIHLVALVAPKPYLAGADGSNAFNQVFAHLLHNEPHPAR